jgi:hypothetical protein
MYLKGKQLKKDYDLSLFVAGIILGMFLMVLKNYHLIIT